MQDHQPNAPRDIPPLRLAPGARVMIRDAEWIVRRVDRTSDNDQLLGSEGISGLVRGRQGMFLASLEEDIQILDPASTELVADDSERFRASLSILEYLLKISFHFPSRKALICSYSFFKLIITLCSCHEKIIDSLFACLTTPTRLD